MEIKLTKDDIKKSLDAKWRKKHFLMFLIIYVIASLLVFFGVHFYPSNKQVVVDSNLPLGLAEIFMFLVFGSFALYYLVRYILLFKDIDSYEKYEVILDKPNTSFNYRHSIYYTVSFTTKTGKKIIKDTAPIFSDWGNIASLHDYNNKKVNIAYNEKNDTLIVLSK